MKLNDSEELSTEGILYQKAEMKYLTVKETERLAKINAIDCALNYNGNIFRDEVKKYENCIPPLEYAALEDKTNFIQCPQSCDFQECIYQCHSKKLNLKQSFKKYEYKQLKFTKINPYSSYHF